VFSLFCLHLALEKIIKAIWVKNNKENFPPKIHHLVRLLEETPVEMDDKDLIFLNDMNKFNIEGRYPDYRGNIYKVCAKSFTEGMFEKAKVIKLCLTKKTAINTVNAFIVACGRSNITFKKVILFGSVASGNNSKYSDIDVALVSDVFTGNPFADWHLLSPANIKFSNIEPHPFTTDYFEKGDPFVDEIKRTGITIQAE